MAESKEDGVAWQVGVWDRMAQVYQQEIDTRFGPVIDQLLLRANLQPGETVLDFGTGTGSVAILAADKVGRKGRVIAEDISRGALSSGGGRQSVREHMWADAQSPREFRNATHFVVAKKSG